jgi:aspartyl-tRNA(Asn)/glutamyl-tRNA(Gln) amidotransferase subunit C
VHIDNALIAYLEDLSCLTLSADEKTRLTGDLQKIVDYMARLGELDTTGVSERSHPFDDVNAFRDDEARPSFDRALILRGAPAHNDTFMLAPKTVE